jgi:hypothetical protein
MWGMVGIEIKISASVGRFPVNFRGQGRPFFYDQNVQEGDRSLRFYFHSSLSPIVSNIYMEHFEQLAVDSAQDKSSLWLRYVDDTFVIWPHGAEGIQNFLNHLNSLRPAIQFTMETESEGTTPSLDVLVEALCYKPKSRGFDSR